MEENDKSKSMLRLIADRIWKDLQRYGVPLLAVAVFYLLMHMFFQAFCPMVVLTGYPCPGCGLTRSVLFFLTGQWERSFFIHPLGFAVVIFFAYCAWFRYVRGQKIPGVRWILVALTLAAVILFLIRMKLYFPNRPPYTYTHGSLLEKIVQKYKLIRPDL